MNIDPLMDYDHKPGTVKPVIPETVTDIDLGCGCIHSVDDHHMTGDRLVTCGGSAECKGGKTYRVTAYRMTMYLPTRIAVSSGEPLA